MPVAGLFATQNTSFAGCRSHRSRLQSRCSGQDGRTIDSQILLQRVLYFAGIAFAGTERDDLISIIVTLRAALDYDHVEGFAHGSKRVPANDNLWRPFHGSCRFPHSPGFAPIPGDRLMMLSIIAWSGRGFCTGLSGYGSMSPDNRLLDKTHSASCLYLKRRTRAYPASVTSSGSRR